MKACKNNLVKFFPFLMIFCILGCQSIGNFKNELDQANALKKLKRGNLSQTGSYTNEYYEFKLNLPKGWQGKVDNPPVILMAEPPQKARMDSYARKFVDIKVIVGSAKNTDSIDDVVENYAKSKAFEILSKRPVYLEKCDANLVMMSGYHKEASIKLIALITLMKQRIVTIECQALSPLFDNVESQFVFCIESFQNTASDIESGKPKPTPDPYNWKDDYIEYTLRKGDRLDTIAKKYMGKESYIPQIRDFNETLEIETGNMIKIPRFLNYLIQQDDTLESVSEVFYGTSKYGQWLKEYNKDTEWETNSEIKVPLYIVQKTMSNEGYVDIASRIYNETKFIDLLLAYNDNRPVNELDKIKLPMFLFNRYYTVKVLPGDTLAFISSWITGTPRNYREIANANGIEAPFTLSTGQILKIPSRLVKDPDVFKRPRPRQKTPPPKQKQPQTSETESKQDDSDKMSKSDDAIDDDMIVIYEPE